MTVNPCESCTRVCRFKLNCGEYIRYMSAKRIDEDNRNIYRRRGLLEHEFDVSVPEVTIKKYAKACPWRKETSHA